MTEAEFQNRLAEYEGMVRLLTAKLEELAAENTRLRSSENNAHSVLREVYNDPTASPAVRVKAAGLALPHETPRLTPVAPPLDLVAEEVEPSWSGSGRGAIDFWRCRWKSALRSSLASGAMATATVATSPSELSEKR